MCIELCIELVKNTEEDFYRPVIGWTRIIQYRGVTGFFIYFLTTCRIKTKRQNIYYFLHKTDVKYVQKDFNKPFRESWLFSPKNQEWRR